MYVNMTAPTFMRSILSNLQQISVLYEQHLNLYERAAKSNAQNDSFDITANDNDSCCRKSCSDYKCQISNVTFNHWKFVLLLHHTINRQFNLGMLVYEHWACQLIVKTTSTL